MRLDLFLLLGLLLTATLYGEVHNSALPNATFSSYESIISRSSSDQAIDIERVVNHGNEQLRFMTFNMLANWSTHEARLPIQHRWPSRCTRVVEYLEYAAADLIGSQELQIDQIEDLMTELAPTYAWYGERREKGGEYEAIFYRHDRLDLLEGKTLPLAESNVVTLGHFRDRVTGGEFIALNMHFNFSSMDSRQAEAEALRDLVSELPEGLPIVALGDFNTFPNRPELKIPFLDGNRIDRIISSGRLTDSREIAVLGQYGSTTSSNFNESTKCAFEHTGLTPGVILDHIYITDGITVLTHTIDPALVDGEFPSDHLPLVADVLIAEPEQRAPVCPVALLTNRLALAG